MQLDSMHVQVQPFIKLAQANMELLTRFSTSPEVVSQATANASQLFQQASGSAMKLMQSGAWAQLMTGMFNNYMSFMGEVSQGGMAAWSEAQASLVQQAQQAAAGAAGTSTRAAGRSRSTA